MRLTGSNPAPNSQECIPHQHRWFFIPNHKASKQKDRFRRPTKLDFPPSWKQAGQIGFAVQVPLIPESLRTNCSSAPCGYRTFYDSIATRQEHSQPRPDIYMFHPSSRNSTNEQSFRVTSLRSASWSAKRYLSFKLPTSQDLRHGLCEKPISRPSTRTDFNLHQKNGRSNRS